MWNKKAPAQCVGAKAYVPASLALPLITAEIDMKFSSPTASLNVIKCIERRKSDKRKLDANILIKPRWDLWNMLNASNTRARTRWWIGESYTRCCTRSMQSCGNALEILTISSFTMSADVMPKLVMSVFRGNTRIARREVGWCANTVSSSAMWLKPQARCRWNTRLKSN